MQVAPLKFEETLGLDDLDPAEPNLLSGDFGFSTSLSSFGQQDGREYYQQLTEPSADSIITATGLAGAIPSLATTTAAEANSR